MTTFKASDVLTIAKHLVFSYEVLLVGGLLIPSLAYKKLRPGLRSIPGPPIAAYTKLWRL